MKKITAIFTVTAVAINFSLCGFAAENSKKHPANKIAIHQNFPVKAKTAKYAAKKTAKISSMKVKIIDGCIGCGTCVSISSSVFSLDDVAKVNQSQVSGHEDKCRAAAKACPAHVIKIM